MEDKKKILVVDDAMDMRVFLSTLFNTGGFQAIAVKSGKEGIQKAKSLKPDLIVLDVMMPEEGGAAMYQDLKADAALAGIPVLMLSAVEKTAFYHYLNMLSTQQGLDIPEPDAYMEKPPDPDALLKRVQSLLSV